MRVPMIYVRQLMARVIALFDKKQIPHEILPQHMRNKNKKIPQVRDF